MLHQRLVCFVRAGNEIPLPFTAPTPSPVSAALGFGVAQGQCLQLIVMASEGTEEILGV